MQIALLSNRTTESKDSSTDIPTESSTTKSCSEPESIYEPLPLDLRKTGNVVFPKNNISSTDSINQLHFTMSRFFEEY